MSFPSVQRNTWEPVAVRFCAHHYHRGKQNQKTKTTIVKDTARVNFSNLNDYFEWNRSCNCLNDSYGKKSCKRKEKQNKKTQQKQTTKPVDIVSNFEFTDLVNWKSRKQCFIFRLCVSIQAALILKEHFFENKKHCNKISCKSIKQEIET